jgi:hypothetical protein
MDMQDRPDDGRRNLATTKRVQDYLGWFIVSHNHRVSPKDTHTFCL